jgi:hypothetical protein
VPARTKSEIFIDFEGNKDWPPTFLGVLERTGTQETFYQFILEETFMVLVPSTQHLQLRTSSLEDILRDLDNRYGREVPIFAWSTHEQDVIDSTITDQDLVDSWSNRVIDAKKIAKRWARIKHPDHEFQKKEFRGRHSLDQYLSLIKYVVPTVHGAGKTGPRLTSLRKTLMEGRSFDSWPRSLKSHWTKLLGHNMHDCFGMMKLLDEINEEPTT